MTLRFDPVDLEHGTGDSETILAGVPWEMSPFYQVLANSPDGLRSSVELIIARLVPKRPTA